MSSAAQLNAEEQAALHFLTQISALRLASPSDPGADPAVHTGMHALNS